MMRTATIVTLGVALAVSGCSLGRRFSGPSGGIVHRVKAGENLYRIGLAYGVPHTELARINNVPNPDQIEIGQEMFVPNATRELPVALITPAAVQADRPALPQGASPFRWPVDGGEVSSSFGPRGESHHDGIDIRCSLGTPVVAARAGRVMYADELRGYGNVLILEHDSGYATVYAHNHKNVARVGQAVRQGETIATVGQTGQAEGPHLHFEVRKENIARNPLFFLPSRRTAKAPTTKGTGS